MLPKAALIATALASFGSALILGLHWIRAQIEVLPEANRWAEIVDGLGSLGILVGILLIYYKINEADKKYYRGRLKDKDKIHLDQLNYKDIEIKRLNDKLAEK